MELSSGGRCGRGLVARGGRSDQALGSKGPGPVPGFGRLTVVDVFGECQPAGRPDGRLDGPRHSGDSRFIVVIQTSWRSAQASPLRAFDRGGRSGMGVVTHLIRPRARTREAGGEPPSAGSLTTTRTRGGRHEYELD